MAAPESAIDEEDFSIMTALPWVFGAIVGMVMWSVIRRLPGELARWLCAPFGNSSRNALVVVTFLSFALLIISGILFQISLVNLFAPSVGALGYPDRRRIGSEVFAASLVGYMALQIFLQLDKLRTAIVSKRRRKQDQ